MKNDTVFGGVISRICKKNSINVMYTRLLIVFLLIILPWRIGFAICIIYLLTLWLMAEDKEIDITKDTAENK